VFLLLSLVPADVLGEVVSFSGIGWMGLFDSPLLQPTAIIINSVMKRGLL